MNLNLLFSLAAILVLGCIGYFLPNAGLQMIFGVFLPYIAVLTFLCGVIWKVMKWAKSPVPFRIPTTCGQQQSLPWIKQNKIDNPSTTSGVIIRMFFEIVLFRSLFRNTKAEIKDGDKISYEWEIFLWVGALAFHYSFLTVLVRHFRFFFEPIPFFVKIIEVLDGFFQIGLPIVLISGFVLLGAVLFLLSRRILNPQVKYISLVADYFPLLLITGIAASGLWMRYVERVDVTLIKQITMGIVSFNGVSAEVLSAASSTFYLHLFFICTLLIYFPFSKLMHAAGVFLSPTRNLANNSRMVRHINPWNPEVKVHSYEAYENDFREKMIEAGLPVDKES